MPLSIAKEQNINAITYASDATVFFMGEIDSSDPSIYLIPFFDKVLEQMDSVVTLDVTALEFINSSGIKCFVSFILEKEPNSKVIFLIDDTKSWQEKTLEVIQSLDEEHIELVVKEDEN